MRTERVKRGLRLAEWHLYEAQLRMIDAYSELEDKAPGKTALSRVHASVTKLRRRLSTATNAILPKNKEEKS